MAASYTLTKYYAQRLIKKLKECIAIAKTHPDADINGTGAGQLNKQLSDILTDLRDSGMKGE